MRIDHIALCVRDLEAMRDFYIEHFGATARGTVPQPAHRAAHLFSRL